jgi:hypothetical protein
MDRQMHNVTSAYQSRSEELDARRNRYLWAMGSRVVLFAVTIAFFRGTPWLLYPSMAVSMFLPYVAVVLANGGRKKPEVGDVYVHDVTPLEPTPLIPLGPGRVIDSD